MPFKKAIFLDRDGVINVEKEYTYKPEEFEFLPDVFKALKGFSEAGYMLFIVTNQSGIGRGYYTLDDFTKLNAWMLHKFAQKGITITKTYFCPHAPEENCECRKPKPGMFLEALREFDIDMAHSWMIGDKESDIQAAKSAHVAHTVLVKSGHTIDEAHTTAEYVVNGVFDTIALIKERG